VHPTEGAEGARLPIRPLTRLELIAVDVAVAGLLLAVYLTTLPRSGAPADGPQGGLQGGLQTGLQGGLPSGRPSGLPSGLEGGLQGHLPFAVCAVLVALIALPVAVRRIWPLPVFVAVVLASLVSLAFGVLPDPLLAAAYTGYTAATIGGHPSRRTWLVIGSSSVVLLFLAVATGTPQPWHSRFATLVPGLALVGASWAAGTAVAQRRAYGIRREEDRLERAVADERLRIAREVHDIVTHNLGVIAVKAAVTRHVARDRPAETLASLEAIERVSREALAEMRQALRVLRDSDDHLGPSPGLGDIRALVGRAEEAGLTVRSELPQHDEHDDIPPGPSLTVYRVVQEALTNVVKHAGPTRCRLTVRNTGRDLLVEVVDDGPRAGRPIRRGASEGFGLAGMRERVEMHDGEMSAGPVAAGGFQVQVTIPYAVGSGPR
jgi:signal transduction histidine kinase